jgi:hypothetical protein
MKEEIDAVKLPSKTVFMRGDGNREILLPLAYQLRRVDLHLIRPVIQARTPSTFAPSSAANSLLLIPGRKRSSTLRIKAANCFRSSSRLRVFAKNRCVLLPFRKGFLTSEESMANNVRMNTWLAFHPTPDFEPEYFSAHLTNDPAREPVAVGSSIPRTIADAAIKTGRDRKDFSVERITTEQYQTLEQFLAP